MVLTSLLLLASLTIALVVIFCGHKISTYITDWYLYGRRRR